MTEIKVREASPTSSHQNALLALQGQLPRLTHATLRPGGVCDGLHCHSVTRWPVINLCNRHGTDSSCSVARDANIVSVDQDKLRLLSHGQSWGRSSWLNLQHQSSGNTGDIELASDQSKDCFAMESVVELDAAIRGSYKQIGEDSPAVGANRGLEIYSHRVACPRHSSGCDERTCE
jgi:hypothetical protein